MLHRRWTRPAKQWSFWTFLVGIIILGVLAVWIEGVRYSDVVPKPGEQANLAPLQLALATASLAAAGPAAMQILYSRDKLAIVVAIMLFTAELCGLSVLRPKFSHSRSRPKSSEADLYAAVTRDQIETAFQIHISSTVTGVSPFLSQQLPSVT